MVALCKVLKGGGHDVGGPSYRVPVIHDFHRRKGGAPMLGASAPGQSGPFGPYGDAPAAEDDAGAAPDAPDQQQADLPG